MSKSSKQLSFEDAMQRLDAIVEAMESGQIGLEESIAKYEEAMGYVAHCRKVLDQAELKIQKIQLDAAGQPQAVPFEAPCDEPTEGNAAPPDDEPESP